MFSWLSSPTKSFAEGAEIWLTAAFFAATLAVVIGLIGEYREKKNGSWWKRHALLAELLVLFGVAGEFCFEGGAFWYSLKLHTLDEREIAEAKTNASAAMLQAGRLGVTVDNLHDFVDAKEQIADAQLKDFKDFAEKEKSESADVIEKLSSSKELFDKARTDALTAAAQAEKDLAAMDAALEKQRIEHDRVVSAITPRGFTVAQESTFVEHLLKYQGTNVSVWRAVTTSADTIPLSIEIVNLLNQAHWKAHGVSTSTGTFAPAIVVERRRGTRFTASDAANSLVAEFLAAHISAGRGNDFDNEMEVGGGIIESPATDVPPDIVIFVGTK